MTIAELQPRQGNVNIEVTVTEIATPREFNKFGKAGRVANAKIKDESGEMTLTLWNEQLDQVKVGDKVKITNGWVSEWQGEKQLSTGKFGTLEVIGKGDVPEPTPTPEHKDEPAEVAPFKPTPDSEQQDLLPSEEEKVE